MKRPTMLVKALLHQAALDLDLSVERDVQTLERRCQHEGFSFLAITLPRLSDALERGIEDGTFTCPTSFCRHGRLPRFLGGFFKRVFDRNGSLLDEPCPETIYWIRQISRFFKKPKIGCSASREKEAIQHFIDVESELREMTSQVERKDLFLEQISRIIWAQVFPELDNLDLVCHHGPGVTADHLLSNERNRIRYWHERSEFTYPSDLHCYPNYGAAAIAGDEGAGTENGSGVRYLDIREEFPVRVVFVPKTLTAPRVIAIEPSHVQYMQQSLKDYVYKALEAHPLTRHSIRFTRQDVNQRLAYSSSIDRRLATLDLKDASDRVHLHLVQRIFKNSGLLEHLEDARSLHATLPNGKNIVLFKYASMGSALCFPVEAMVFYTLIQSAMHQLDGRRPSNRSIMHYSRKIDIYGDDIIVPIEYADAVVNNLESYALKVNVNKSFRNSHFRESCGADYYKGIPVNPVYARTIPHDNSRHWGPEEVMSWNATADLFYIRGKWHIAQTIRDLVSRVVRRTIPKTRILGSGIAHFSFIFSTRLHWNADLHCWKQKRLHYDPIKRKDSIDGDELACLNKWGQYVHSRQDDVYSDDRYTLSCWITQLEGSRTLLRRSKCRDDVTDPIVDTSVNNGGVCSLQTGLLSTGVEPCRIQDLVASRTTAVDVGTRPGEGSREDRAYGRDFSRLTLTNLFSGRSEGLSFTHSVNRGRFKSKCRWVSLAG